MWLDYNNSNTTLPSISLPERNIFQSSDTVNLPRSVFRLAEYFGPNYNKFKFLLTASDIVAAYRELQVGVFWYIHFRHLCFFQLLSSVRLCPQTSPLMQAIKGASVSVWKQPNEGKRRRWYNATKKGRKTWIGKLLKYKGEAAINTMIQNDTLPKWFTDWQ